MADGSYIAKVYRAQGGDTLVVASGGAIKIETGGKIVPNSGTQATVVAAITAADAATQGGTYAQADVQTIATLATANKAAINAILAALKGAGIIASS